MDMTLRPGVDLSDAEIVSLGGVTFKIGRLMLRQTAKIAPVLPAVLAAINRRSRLMAGVTFDEDGKPNLTKEQMVEIMLQAAPTEEEVERYLRVILAGVSRAHPNVTMDDILDLPAHPDELISAVNVVLAQSRQTRSASEVSPGEA